MEGNEDFIEDYNNIMEGDDHIMEENEHIMECSNTEGGLSLYQLSTSAIVSNFTALRDEILQCPEKVLFDVFYQV